MSDAAVVTIAALAFVAFLIFLIRSAWKAFTPRGVGLYFLMWFFMILAGVFSADSTLPSLAPRRQTTGIITDVVDHKEGKSHTYTFGLARPNEDVLKLQASATLPFFAEGRDLVSVTYLEEKAADRFPRVIKFHVLTGPRTGYNDAVSADWFGPWLGVIICPLFSFGALWFAFDNKRVKHQS